MGLRDDRSYEQSALITVDSDVFLKTYRKVSPASFVKVTPVWAEIAATPGTLATLEGTSDTTQETILLVSNNEDGTDAYCMSKERFEAMYELDK